MNPFSITRMGCFLRIYHKPITAGASHPPYPDIIGFGLILRDDERHRPLRVFIKFHSIACRGGVYVPARSV